MPRKFSAEFKFEVVRQLQSGEKRLSQVCREHDLDAKMVRDWRSRVEKYGPQAFPRSTSESDAGATPSGNVAALEARIGDLERLVGQLALENDFLKKALRRANSLPRKGGS